MHTFHLIWGHNSVFFVFSRYWSCSTISKSTDSLSLSGYFLNFSCQYPSLCINSDALHALLSCQRKIKIIDTSIHLSAWFIFRSLSALEEHETWFLPLSSAPSSWNTAVHFIMHKIGDHIFINVQLQNILPLVTKKRMTGWEIE